MTKTKQWILSVIFAAVLVSALFFGIMLSDPVYITARAEVSPRAASTISLDDLQTVSTYEVDNMTWEIGVVGAENANVWRLNKQFKEFFANDNNAPAFTKDDEFYQYATIDSVQSIGNGDATPVAHDDIVSSGNYSVTVKLAENSKYQFATVQPDGSSTDSFALNVMERDKILLNNVSLRMPLTEGASWNFTDVVNALREDKLNGATDPNNSFLGMTGFYNSLQIASMRDSTNSVVYEGATTMTIGVYKVQLALPQGSSYVWDTTDGSDTFTLTVYQNVSLTDVNITIDYTENLYWQTNTETAGRNYLTPAADAFKQGLTNPSQSIQNLFTDEFLSNLRITSVRNFSDSSEIALGSAVNAGTYTLTLEFVNQNGLYQWTDAYANQLTLNIAKKKINLGSYQNMHWALMDGSELLSDPVYQYTYTTAGSSEVQTYYSLTQLTYAPNSQWSNWTYVTQTQSQYSVARYTGTTVQIQVVFGGLGDLMDGAAYITATSIAGMSYVPNRTSSSQVSKQQASVVLTLSNSSNYEFDERIDTDVAGSFALNRGLTIAFSNGNQTATITKEWFAAASHNILMDGESSGNQVEFSVPDWTFGQNPSLAAPRLAHVGNGQNEFGGYTATLTNLDNPNLSYPNITANNWADYFNRFMPAGRYQLLINVAASSVEGSHTDWWNGETHDMGNVTFLAHNASYTFTVSKDIMVVDESAVNSFGQMDDFNTKVVTGSGAIDYSKLFESVKNLVFAEGTYVTAEERQANGGHWASENSLFDNAPICVFKTMSMFGDSYYTATDSVWSSHFTTVGSYTVLYKVTMKNYVTVGESNPYEHYFSVSLCRIITQKPVLATLSYNGANQTPYLINSDVDRIYYEVVAGQSFMEVGTHAVKIAIKDQYKAYVMWSETDETGITTVQLTINPTENFWRVSPRINNWNYGDAVPSPEGDAFYFNVANGDTKTFKYFKVDANGNLIDPNSSDTRLERFAVNGQIPIGRYALVTVITVGPNGGYSGLSTQDGGYYIFEVRPTVNYWVSQPFMADIVYGEYDPAINQPTATAYQYNPDLGDHIQFQFRKTAANGFADFSAPVTLSKDTPIGKYALITTFTVGEGNQNYGAVNDGIYTVSYFYILPTANSLIVNPVTTWQYGAYTDEASTQTAKAKFFNAEHDEFVYTYFEAELKGGVVVKKENAQAKTINELKVQGVVPAGFYILELKLVVDGDGSYSGLTQEYTIEVTQTANHWTEFPRIASWSVGDTPNVPQAKAAFGTANIVIKSGNTVMYTTADGWLNPCVAGYYTLEATVDGTRDYAGIPTYRTEFRVFQAGNSGTSVDKDVNGVNVKVEAAMVTGTEVKVSAIASDDAAYQKVKTALESRDMTVCAGYKVEFVLNNETISPDGRVTVTITLSDELKGKVGLSAYDANGIALGSVLNADGTITFSTTNPEGCFLAYSANSGSTDAGFIIALVAMIILIVGLVVVAIFVIRNAQKQKLEEDDEYDEEDENEEDEDEE